MSGPARPSRPSPLRPSALALAAGLAEEMHRLRAAYAAGGGAGAHPGGAAGASALFEAEAQAGEEAEVEVDDQPPPPPPPSSSSSAPPSPPPDPALLARRLAAVRYRQGKVGLGSAVQAAARARPAELDGGDGKN